MNFTEIIFSALFLPDLLRFRLGPGDREGAQLTVLLLASYVFYAWWRLDFLALILFSSGIDFVMGAAIHRTSNQRRRKLFLIISLCANLGLLGYFKYCDFFIAQINRVLGLADWSLWACWG